MDANPIVCESVGRLDAVLSLVATVVLVAIAVVTMHRAFRALLAPGDGSRLMCRRWARVASLVVIAWSAIATVVCVDTDIPILVAIAAADCWLVSWLLPPPAIPRATARRRRASAI